LAIVIGRGEGLAIIKLIRKWRMQGVEAIEIRKLFLNYNKYALGDSRLCGYITINGKKMLLMMNINSYEDMRVKTICSPKSMVH